MKQLYMPQLMGIIILIEIYGNPKKVKVSEIVQPDASINNNSASISKK